MASAEVLTRNELSEEEREWSLYLAFAKDLIEESREAAGSQWGDTPEPWRDDRATDSQIKLIRFRRCGPDFQHRLPEALYKSVVYMVTGGLSHRNVRSKGEATDILNAFAYADGDVLALWSGYVRRVKSGELTIAGELKPKESDVERRRRRAQAFYADMGDEWGMLPS